MADSSSKRSWQDLADFNLKRPEEVLALVELFQQEWYNGGFSQLFSNWNRADIVLIPEALRMVGAAESAPIVDAAIAEFPADQDDWRYMGHEALVNPSSSLRPRLWELNRMLDSHIDALTKAIVDYELKLSEDEDP